MTVHRPYRRLTSIGRFGALLTVVGALLAADSLANLSFVYKLWPLLILLLGSGVIGIHVRRARREPLYVGVGTYLLGFSALALYCSLTSWGALTTLWPAFVAILGISFCTSYLFGGRSPAVLLAGLLLISTSAVFYFVFAVNPQLWWTVFFLAGASFLAFDWARRTA